MSKIKSNGVDVVAATAQQLASFITANQKLNAFKIDKIFDSKDENARVFFALFDGTGNDAIADPQNISNIGILKNQLDSVAVHQRQIAHVYREGPGTQRKADFFSLESPALERFIDRVTGDTYHPRIEDMYHSFAAQSKKWLTENPNVKISVVSIGFSRGAEQAAGFSRLVDQHGVMDPDSRVIEKQAYGIRDKIHYGKKIEIAHSIVQAVGLFDPVGTLEPQLNDRRLPNSVVSGFQITANDEFRKEFPSSEIINQGPSEDGRFLGVTVAGCHSNIGGSYTADGLSKRSFNLMAKFLADLVDIDVFKKLDVTPDVRNDVIHDSSQHQWFYTTMKVRGTVSAGRKSALQP